MDHTVTHFGSQSAVINSQSAEHYSKFLTDAVLDAKKVCVIHYDDLVKLETTSALLKQLDAKGASGLIVLLINSDRAHGGFKGSEAE